ncbi:histidine phosphatase family protein [Brevibacillus formosus]|uniref:Histidine phosphatase family protein n=1 Tax=Brevibacillus formosus TaxID=54913 RepID=A0A220MLU0_9BACL|nr:histidine phosphatase family protein [Brevibacillus formosus]ASJ56067.1 histidine phosphatase family protein [Brevibacillus formosus]
MKTIYLVRHCQADGQEPEALLTEKGEAQARELTTFFAGSPIDRIISSPYHRAIATIRPLAQERGIVVEEDTRLVERVLSGVPREDWFERLRDTFDDLTLEFEGGESSLTAINRANSLLTEILADEHNDIVLVSHGCLLALLMKSIDDRFGFPDWEKLSNPDVFKLTCHLETRELVRIWS